MCASVGVKAKGESDQMMRNEGGGVFPESLARERFELSNRGRRRGRVPAPAAIAQSKTRR